MMDEVALARVRVRMEIVDSLPPDLRACVHEYGLTIVQAMMQAGVTQARHIHHLVRTVREGSSEVGERNRTDEMKREIERRYAGYLRGGGWLVVPQMPTPEMVKASVDALHNACASGEVVERSRKHTIRLMHANVAGHAEAFGKV